MADESRKREKIPAEVVVRASLSAAAFFVALGLIMFGPAGLGWTRGLAFYVVFAAVMAGSSIYLWRANPDIFAARGRIRKGTKLWDQVLVRLIIGSFLGVFAAAAFDARAGGAAAPAWVVAAGYAMFAAGYAGSTWVMAVNKFAEPSVRIQADRRQTVVDTGPYAVVRHPLYAASVVMIPGIALALGSYWALLPAAAGAVVIVVRTALEDRTLRKELAGYEEYAGRVRYRLVPGVW